MFLPSLISSLAVSSAFIQKLGSCKISERTKRMKLKQSTVDSHKWAFGKAAQAALG